MNCMRFAPIPILGLVLALAPSIALSQGTPGLLNLQARIADAAGNPLSGPVTVEVRIYDVAAGGAPLWSEVHAATALNGVVNLLMGVLTPLPPGLFASGTRYIAFKVGFDPEMTPRRQIASVPFSRRSAGVDALDPTTSVPVGLITSAHILDGTITPGDLADASVTAPKLAAGAVTQPALAPGSIGTPALATQAVTTAVLADSSVTGAKLSAGAVGSAALAPNSVDGTRIVNRSIDALDLASPLTGSGLPPVLSAEATGLVNAQAIRGHASATTGANYGGWFESDSTSGYGVYATSPNIGVRGNGSSYGIYGHAAAAGAYGGFFTGGGFAGRYALRAQGDVHMMGGKAGILTTSPAADLHVAGTGDAEPGGGGVLVVGLTSSGNLAMDGNEIMARNNGSTSPLYLNNDGGNVHMVVGGTGAVSIGTTTIPAGVKLAVKGKVLCEEMEVQLFGDWPDYVFDEGYELMSLEGVEGFLRENRHLPGVPSAASLKKTGLNVGEMQATLLRKVEELTLHLIALNKEVRSLQEENRALKAGRGAIEMSGQ